MTWFFVLRIMQKKYNGIGGLMLSYAGGLMPHLSLPTKGDCDIQIDFDIIPVNRYKYY